MRPFVVDTSAIYALVLDEPDADRFKMVLLDGQPVMSAATRVEVAHGIPRKLGPAAVAEVEALLDELGVAVEPFDAEQARLATAALTAYGKGRGEPPAVLNLGDAFSYALAKSRGLPLPYKGDDFGRTDIVPALAGTADPA